MLNKVFLDTNIVMDLFDQERRSSIHSIKAIEYLLDNNAVLYVNSDTLTTAFYLLRHQKKATFKESLNAIRETSILCDLISIEQQDVLEALTLCEDDKTAYKDYEDTLQYVCAKKADVSLVLTNDKGFVSENIKCLNSKIFLESLV